MKIIIPMAGIGKRMRPHTLSRPKPLLPVAGKAIVERLIENITSVIGGGIEEVNFISGNFGNDVDRQLKQIADKMGYKSRIFYQYEALGTAHALWCAKEALDGNILVAYADTLFHSKFEISKNEEGVIWVKKIADPRLFGVVITDEKKYVTQFAEKPKEFVSDLAIIGIYYFRHGEKLKHEIQTLIEKDLKGNGEYQLTDALTGLMKKGVKFKTVEVEGWFDCGNKNAMVHTNKEILKLNKDLDLISSDSIIINSRITKPCFIDEGVKIINSEIGPYVSIGKNTVIEDSKISDSIIMNESYLKKAYFSNSMIGNFVHFTSGSQDLSIGDYSELH